MSSSASVGPSASQPALTGLEDDQYDVPVSPASSVVFISVDEEEAMRQMELEAYGDASLPEPKLELVAVVPKIELSREQHEVLLKVMRGENVFFTGSAGTGKSVLLREIIKVLNDPQDPSKLVTTASTGIAALNIGGVTLHSWAGIGLGDASLEKLIEKIWNVTRFRRRWMTVQSLIIDEISMIDGRLFDKLDGIAQIIRDNARPFGGIQLILSGDFCQLPPVVPPKDGASQLPHFAFDSRVWQRCIDKPVTLTQVFRQKEQGFVDMLNQIRYGNVTSEIVQRFKQLSRRVHYEDGIGPTELYPTRMEVDNANNTQLDRIEEDTMRYDAYDRPGIDSKGRVTSKKKTVDLLDRLPCQRQITLKVGAQVMLIKNLEQGVLVNGSIGKVLGFRTYAEATQNQLAAPAPGPTRRKPQENCNVDPTIKWPLVRFTNGRERLCIEQDFTVNNGNGQVEAARSQVPLILAWAMSVHKSQGQTFERVKVDLSRTFEKGQAYVALSRATTMDKLEVLNFNPTKIMAHPRVLEWHGQFEGKYPRRYSDRDDKSFIRGHC